MNDALYMGYVLVLFVWLGLSRYEIRNLRGRNARLLKQVERMLALVESKGWEGDE